VTRLVSIAERLDSIVDELDEIAFDRLREASAVADGGSGPRPEGDREITRARRAVEKAALLLRSIDADPDPDPDLAG
jgi:hypothetical protein